MSQKMTLRLFLLLLFVVFPHLMSANNCYEVCAINSTSSTIVCSEELQLEIVEPLSYSNPVPEYQTGKLYVKVKENTNTSLEYDANNPRRYDRQLRPIIEAYDIYRIEKAFKRLPEMQQYYRLHFTTA